MQAQRTNFNNLNHPRTRLSNFLHAFTAAYTSTTVRISLRYNIFIIIYLSRSPSVYSRRYTYYTCLYRLASMSHLSNTNRYSIRKTTIDRRCRTINHINSKIEFLNGHVSSEKLEIVCTRLSTTNAHRTPSRIAREYRARGSNRLTFVIRSD